MNKTTNFDLPQWVKADQIKMDDFNAAFASIDAALKAEGDARSEADGTAAERITAWMMVGLDWLASGRIRTEGIIDPIVPFDQSAEAYRAIDERPAESIKLGIRFD